MRIAHVSDVHIRNVRYHDEYEKTFEDLYGKLSALRPDIIVNTGDTAHTKSNISPEFVRVASRFLRKLGEIAPTHVILGNHDTNLRNDDRLDAISPIVESLGGEDAGIFLHKKSGRVCVGSPMDSGPTFNLWVFSMVDAANYPVPADWAPLRAAGEVNIGLFHGSVKDALTDQGWRMTSEERPAEIFSGLDYVMMGDIHRQQFIDAGRRIAYAGSLVQQNFGESPTKGFLLWDVRTATDHDVEFHEVRGSRGFYTVKLTPELAVEADDIPPGARVRIVAPRPMTLTEQRAVERIVRADLKPDSIVSTVDPNSAVLSAPAAARQDVDGIRALDVQERLLKKFFEGRSVPDDTMEAVLALNERFQVHLEQEEEVSRNVRWSIKTVSWDGMFNYGAGNVFDLSSMHGLTGIFAPNAAGKSSMVDVVLETLFDRVSKDGVPRNVDLINDNLDSANMIVDISVGDEELRVERKIERLKTKGDSQKEWGKTTLDLSRIVDGEEEESLTGDSRPETERKIRRAIGSFEDFCLTALVAQHPILGVPGGGDVVNCRETDRRKILCRFLDLDMFEAKWKLAKDELRVPEASLSKVDVAAIDEEIEGLSPEIEGLSFELARLGDELDHEEAALVELDVAALELSKERRATASDSSPQEVEEKIVKFTRTKESVVTNRELLIEEMKKRSEDLVAANAERSSLDRSAITAAIKREGDLERRLDALVLAKREIEKHVADADYRSKTLEKVPCGDSFLECQFLKEAAAARKSLPILAARISNLCGDLERARTELSEARADPLMGLLRRLDELDSICDDRIDDRSKTLLERYTNELALIEDREGELRGELVRAREAEDSIRINEEVAKGILVIAARRNDHKRRSQELAKTVSKLGEELAVSRERLSVARRRSEELARLRIEVEALRLYAEAVGKSGIPYTILAERLPTINEEINKILGNVVGFQVFLEHDAEEDTVRLRMQYGEYRSRSLTLASGAERFIASLAIRVALLSVSSLPRPNILIVDEGFGKLDPAHFESVAKMFDYLRSMFDHVVVISHVDAMRDIVDNNVEITVDADGYAHVET